MSASVTLSIATNTAIAASKAFGWFVTGSPTLFAETIHSLADIGNQVLLKVGEVRGRAGPDPLHPFGRGQETFFWSLVSAVSVFFVGCGINLYHGVQALLSPVPAEPFTLLVLGLLVFSFALEAWTFRTALRELGGLRALRRSHSNVTVLAVLLEDAVALLGIALTLVVAGVSLILGPHPEFDATVAIIVGLLLGVMALFLAALNRRFLIDTTDPVLDQEAAQWLAGRDIEGDVRSLVLDDRRAIVFVHARGDVAQSEAVGRALAAHLEADDERKIEAVYWRFKATS